MEKKLSLRLKYLEFVFLLLFFLTYWVCCLPNFQLSFLFKKNIKTHKNHISNNMVLRDNTRFFCLFVCLDCQWEKLKEPQLHFSMLPSTVKL